MEGLTILIFMLIHFRVMISRSRNAHEPGYMTGRSAHLRIRAEKARRRDPRKYHYSSTACPDFKKGVCRKGDACEYGHAVFEYWLHPTRYRTQSCKDGTHCHRRVCFFAHTSEQLRVLTPEESPGHIGCDSSSRLTNTEETYHKSIVPSQPQCASLRLPTAETVLLLEK
ncbi:CCCH-type Zn-finger protein [Forsythia ovata]|uniref:CCCH-type Zn-finger protein n=1 Tax=Forsythia ovata TaxID=205694 RepID=A0ABD1UEI0_9LAMI